MVGFKWLPIVDQAVLVACQIFSLERAYKLLNKSKWVLVIAIPPM